MPAEGGRGKNEADSGAINEKSSDGRTGRSTDDGGTAKQQRYYGYGHRICERQTDDAAPGRVHYSGG